MSGLTPVATITNVEITGPLGELVESVAVTVEIKDSTGAGDTFLAALVFKYLIDKNIYDAINFANECATLVVQQKGVNTIQ